MSTFCETEFWNSTWIYPGNKSVYPNATLVFTPCFEKSIFLTIPCIYLWSFICVEVCYLFKKEDRDIPWSFLNISKIIFTCILLIDEIVLLGFTVHYKHGEMLHGVDVFSPSILAVSILLQLLVLVIEKKRGVQSSAYLFIFWFMMSVFGIFPFITQLRSQQSGDIVESVEFTTQMIYFPCVLVMLLLNFFADKRPRYLRFPRSENSSPEDDSSFPSKITFSWADGLVWKGYKNPLSQDLLWDLSYSNSSKKITQDWDKQWNRSVSKPKKSGNEMNSYFPEHVNEHFSRNNSSYGRMTLSSKGGRVEQQDPEDSKQSTISVRPIIAKTFGPGIMEGAIYKICTDILVFISPQLVKFLISFIVDASIPTWYGYMCAVLLLLVSQLQSFFEGFYFYKMFSLGLQARTAVISVIYRKALKISSSAKRESSLGEIVNLMSVDAQKIMDFFPYMHFIWAAPLKIILALYFLWEILGVAVLAGVAAMVLLIPINGLIAHFMNKLHTKIMKLKDQRSKITAEILNGIKVLKLYAWETSFEERVLAIRDKEISILKTVFYLDATTSFTFTCAPYLACLASFGVFVTVMGQELGPSTAFVSLVLFDLIRIPLTYLPYIITELVQVRVSLKRINKFINAEELDSSNVSKENISDISVLMENGTFSWGHGENESNVLKKLNLKIHEGSLVAVVGTVGAGKSSLCSAILGEMEKISGKVNVKGSVAYVPQQAWIQNATLEGNILFGGDKNDAFYSNVIDACALKVDFTMLPAGDKTEIGEKGINLSGGQKQRVSLARAVYSDADLYLLDDPLSAVDSHVGKHIFENVIGPQGLLKKKTRILVTHGLAYLRHMDHIVVLKDGEISEQGTYSELIANKGDFQEFLLQHLSEQENEEEEDLEIVKTELEKMMGRVVVERQISLKRLDSSSSNEDKPRSFELNGSISAETRKGTTEDDHEKIPLMEVNKIGEQLIEEEKTEIGRVSTSVYKHYLKSVGFPTSVLILILSGVVHVVTTGSNFWLSRWSTDQTASKPDVRNMYLGVYGALGLIQAIIVLMGQALSKQKMVIASASVFRHLLHNIMRQPQRFFDTTPIGRILNRFTKDTNTIDLVLPHVILVALHCIFHVIATVAVISYTTPIIILILLPTLTIYFFIQMIYLATSRQLKRLESISKSPIYSHFGESVQGSSIIRAFGKVEEFSLESERMVDQNQAAYFPGIVTNRWLAIRLEFVGNILTFFSALFAVIYRDTITGGGVGLSVSYALSVTQMLNWLVRTSSEVETNIVSVERMKEYSEIPQEAPWSISDQKPPKAWPEKGTMKFDSYSTRYRDELDLVIKKISFKINPMEKIGIVGRTGAGKSSLTLALFRIIEPAGGKIVIDGIDISKIGLHDLRGKLTIIPQDPVLFSGTLRTNLDPFNQYSDQAVWDALEHSHLKNFVSELGSKLQHDISEGGENLSVGQRQLVCLARALLRKTKVLILDEATAAVDLETDNLIQETIRREFADCTILTIAHRLNTIMDSNRVLVLDNGQISEFDSPVNLLSNRQSLFFSMAKEAGIA